MRTIYTLILLLAVNAGTHAQVSRTKIDAKQFFKTDSVIEVKIVTDLRQLLSNKMKEGQRIRGKISGAMQNNREINEPVTLEVRGNMRKQICNMPPVKVNFKSTAAPALSSLGSLKLVNVCRANKQGNEYLFKEYLIYKIYNLLTEKSLRARLLKITYEDSSGKKNPINTFGFLLEDVKDMAKRNQSVERKRDIRHMELTERRQMSRVAMFEYMIGNLDWSVRARHNIKLIVSNKDTNAVPVAVPYDFDYAGLVNTDYAVPPAEFELENVTIRKYRGYVRTPDELQVIADEFLNQKNKIYSLIKEFDLLPSGIRNQMIDYLEPFFELIARPNKIRSEFIDGARKD